MKKVLFKILSTLKYYQNKKKCICADNIKFGPFSYISNNNKQVIFGKGCFFYGRINISKEGTLKIGNYTHIRFDTIIEVKESIQIGNNVVISNSVIISDNDSHSTNYRAREKMTKSGESGDLWSWKYANSNPIIIEDNVWIGRRAIINKGVHIGKGSIIGSAAVVTKNIPPYSLCYGNPCVVIEGKYK